MKVNFFLQVKALLLFMWKHVNNREKTAEVARSRVRVLISSAGSLNLYGSGLFSDFFLTMWQAEGFPTYTEPAKQEGPEKGSVRQTPLCFEHLCLLITNIAAISLSNSCGKLR